MSLHTSKSPFIPLRPSCPMSLEGLVLAPPRHYPVCQPTLILFSLFRRRRHGARLQGVAERRDKNPGLSHRKHRRKAEKEMTKPGYVWHHPTVHPIVLLHPPHTSRIRSRSWEDYSRTASQVISRLLWNTKVHRSANKIPPQAIILSQLYPVRTRFLCDPLILPSHRVLGLRVISSFVTKIVYAFLISPTRGTCPAHLIILDFITLIIFGKQNKLRRSSSCNSIQPLVLKTPSL
jgi:hypothetical protein